MDQRFNFNGIPNGETDNTYGELTNSLIYPGTFPFPPIYQEGWTTAPDWQASNPNFFSMGNGFPGQMMGSNSYYPLQQDYMAFDEGDDPYRFEDAHQQTGQESEQTVDSPFDPKLERPSTQQSHLNLTIENATSELKLQDRAQTQHTRFGMNSETPGQKLANLRARLLAQKKVGGQTPTPEPKLAKLGDDMEASKTAEGQITEQLQIRGRSLHENSLSDPHGMARASALPQKMTDDKSTSKSIFASSQPSHTSTDIEALLAEARDTSMAKHDISKSTNNVEHANKGISTREPSRNGAALPSHPNQELVSNPTTTMNQRQSRSSRNASSEASEQGEIREPLKEKQKAPKTLSAPIPSKSTKPEAQHKEDTMARDKAGQNQSNLNLAKRQPEKIDTTLANGRSGGSGTASAKFVSPTSARTPSISKTRDARDARDAAPTSDPRDSAGRSYGKRERLPEPTWSLERRPENDRGRPREIPRESPRESHVRDQNEKFRAHLASRKEAIEANERAAAEYKRNLQLAKNETRDVIMTDAPSDAKENKEPPTPDAVEYFADVDEWLTMTGYHDKPYRKKALIRHRKLVELDEQRAELEREAQAEHEERSHLARAQSIKPRESTERPSLRSAIAQPSIPSFSMPPPPVPAKDDRHDMGIQIKDLAQRESGAAQRRAEDGSRGSKALNGKPSVPLSHAVKRQHSDEDLDNARSRAVEKVARTDSQDFSSEKKVQASPLPAKVVSGSLESRISVNENALRRSEYPKGKSTEFRRRSLSPAFRRASVHEPLHTRTQHSRGSPGSRTPSRHGDFSRNGSADRSDGELSSHHHDGYEGNARHQYYNDSYRFNYDNRSVVGYNSYYPSSRGGPYSNQYVSPNYRGRVARGRGRISYLSNRGSSYNGKAYDDAIGSN